MGQLYTDLVVTAGVQLDFKFRYIRQSCVFAGEVAVRGRDGVVAQSGGLCTAGAWAADTGEIGAGVFDEIVFQCAFGGGGTAFYEGTVVFAEALAGKLAV